MGFKVISLPFIFPNICHFFPSLLILTEAKYTRTVKEGFTEMSLRDLLQDLSYTSNSRAKVLKKVVCGRLFTDLDPRTTQTFGVLERRIYLSFG